MKIIFILSIPPLSGVDVMCRNVLKKGCLSDTFEGYIFDLFFGGNMPRIFDTEVPSGITAREHPVRKFGMNRIKWPFKNMVVNDYCLVDAVDAQRARNALKSFYRRFPARRFSNRPLEEGSNSHIIRRVQ